ncbi:uroporphyrinogen-III synthase [Motilimonas sp. KMU-193]|uniref:uroporphyrinogen-III synthase n=1 Tax=Motilimonas sp. KMU-193 TaxID=3388668 RepID=UPI00396B23F1
MTAQPRILVTRPEKHQQSLLDALHQQGWFAIGQPLLTITTNPDITRLIQYQTQLDEFDIIIAISDNAVAYTHQWLQQQLRPWPAHSHYYAIGANTATQWQQLANIVARYPLQADSEGLLQMPELSAVAGHKVLLLKGNGGRDLIASELSQRGAKVIEIGTYQRQPITLNAAETVAKWQHDEINSVIITSGEILSALLNIVPKSERNWLFQLNLIVISQRIAKLAQAAGFTQIRIAQGASPTALIQCLQEIK